MKKQLVLVGVAVLLIVVGLSGCNESNQESKDGEDKTHYLNIGDSIIFGDIKYTFLSAEWELYGEIYYFNIEVKVENLGNEAISGILEVEKYEMENGYIYKPLGHRASSIFTLNPGKNKTDIIEYYEIHQYTTGSGIDRDYLPVSKVYIMELDSFEQDFGVDIVLNVL